MKVCHPTNELYVEKTHTFASRLLVYFFPVIYFAFKGNWRHAIGLVLLSPLWFFTVGLAWYFFVGIIYASRIGSINRKDYLRKGWMPVI